MVKSLSVILASLAISFPLTAKTTTKLLFSELNKVVKSGEGLNQILVEVRNLDFDIVLESADRFDKSWPKLKDNYSTKLRRQLSKYTPKKRSNREIRKISQLRRSLSDVYQLDPEKAGNQLNKVAKKAFSELLKMHQPSFQEILPRLSKGLQSSRASLEIYASFRDEIGFRLGEPATISRVREFQDLEAQEASKVSYFSKDGLLLMEKNNSLAIKANLGPRERQCIQLINKHRLALGIPPLKIEPRLSRLALSHSRLMKKKNTFVTPQRITGKVSLNKKPIIRTEDIKRSSICRDRTSAQEAFAVWFAKHENFKRMFAPKTVKIGIGRSGTYWTALYE